MLKDSEIRQGHDCRGNIADLRQSTFWSAFPELFYVLDYFFLDVRARGITGFGIEIFNDGIEFIPIQPQTVTFWTPIDDQG